MDTYKTRIRQYERRERLTTWFGAGYLAVTALMTTKVFEQANPPAPLTAILITLIVFGGGSLGFARVGFEWAATLLRRQIEDATVQENDTLLPADNEWPNRAEQLWVVSILSMAAAGLVALLCAWWPVLPAFTLPFAFGSLLNKLKSMALWSGLLAVLGIVSLVSLIVVACDEYKKRVRDPARQGPQSKWLLVIALGAVSFVLQIVVYLIS